MSLIKEDKELIADIKKSYLAREKKASTPLDYQKLDEQLQSLEKGILIVRDYMNNERKKGLEQIQKELSSVQDIKKAYHHLTSQLITTESHIRKDEDELLPWLVIVEEAIQNSKDPSILKKMGSELPLELAFLTRKIDQKNVKDYLGVIVNQLKDKGISEADIKFENKHEFDNKYEDESPCSPKPRWTKF